MAEVDEAGTMIIGRPPGFCWFWELWRARDDEDVLLEDACLEDDRADEEVGFPLFDFEGAFFDGIMPSTKKVFPIRAISRKSCKRGKS